MIAGVSHDPDAREPNDKQKSQIELILPEGDRKNFGQLPNFDDDDDEGFRLTPIKFNLRPIQTDDFFRPFTPFFSGVQGKNLFIHN